MILENHKGWMRDNESYEHSPEFAVINNLNTEFLNLIKEDIGLKAERANDKYGCDINILAYNYLKLKYINLVGKIEVENKPNDDFPIVEETFLNGETIKYQKLPERWTHYSFLDRKVGDTDKFKDSYAYVLCNKKPHNKIFWATFGEIRRFCHRVVKVPNNKKEIYWRAEIGISDFFLYNGYNSLAEYFVRERFKKRV